MSVLNILYIKLNLKRVKVTPKKIKQHQLLAGLPSEMFKSDSKSLNFFIWGFTF